MTARQSLAAWDGTWPSMFCRRPPARRRGATEDGRPSYKPPTFDYGEVIAHWLRTGDSPSDVARCFHERDGVNLDMVRRAITACSFPWERAWVARRKEARRRLRALGERGHACRVCGRWFVPSCETGDSCGRIAFCSGEHQQAFTRLRLHVSDTDHRTHNIAVARIAYRKDPTDANLGRLRRSEAGTSAPRPRWFNKGSKNLATAVEAYRNGWPIFDELPESCQTQVIAAARAEDEMAR